MSLRVDVPIRVGGLSNGIMVDELEIDAFAINLGSRALSVVLVHPASGWKISFVYRDDDSVLAFWGELCAATGQSCAESLTARIWAKLQADGKLPAGSVDAVVPAAAVGAQQLAKAQAAAASPAIASPLAAVQP